MSPRALDQDLLATALLAGHTDDQIARDFRVSARTVRRERARARATHGPDWPRVRPSDKRAPAQAPQIRVPQLAPDAEPDEIERWALAAIVAATSAPTPLTLAVVGGAKAALEIADRRRRGRPAEVTIDVDQVRDRALLAIERAIEGRTH